jgi:hypothetical protein
LTMKIAICCDQGVPPELMRDALTVGKALTERGHSVSYIVGDPVSFVEYAGSYVPSALHQAPVLRSAPHLVMKRPPADGFADVMTLAGFDDKVALFCLASVWSHLLHTIKPDAIVGFYSPIVWLVGPGHATTFAIGNGFVLPPPLGASFPRLSVDSSPLADEGVILGNANAVLARLGRPALASISDVLTNCVSLLYGMPVFDPYLQLRRTLTMGLLGDAPKPTVPPAEPRLAVFLDVNCPGVEMIMLAVASNDAPADVYIRGATTGMRMFLEQQPNVTVWADHEALLQGCANASVLVHHGEQDVAQRCITFGRPQLIIPWTREQEVLNYVLGWMGFTWMKKPDISIGEMAGTLRDIVRDTSLTVAAQHHARQVANSNLDDALPAIVNQIEASAFRRRSA